MWRVLWGLSNLLGVPPCVSRVLRGMLRGLSILLGVLMLCVMSAVRYVQSAGSVAVRVACAAGSAQSATVRVESVHGVCVAYVCGVCCVLCGV